MKFIGFWRRGGALGMRAYEKIELAKFLRTCTYETSIASYRRTKGR